MRVEYGKVASMVIGVVTHIRTAGKAPLYIFSLMIQSQPTRVTKPFPFHFTIFGNVTIAVPKTFQKHTGRDDRMEEWLPVWWISDGATAVSTISRTMRAQSS